MISYEEEIEMVDRQIENAINIAYVTVCKADMDSDEEYFDESDVDSDEEYLNDEYSGEEYKPGRFYLQTVEHFRDAGCKVSIEDYGSTLVIDATHYNE